MRRRIYIETTIPSFYYEVRSEPAMVARREWTRQWWDRAARADDLLTSEPVLDGIASPLRLLGHLELSPSGEPK